MNASPQVQQLAAMLLNEMKNATTPDPKVEEHTQQGAQTNDLINQIMQSMVGQVAGGSVPQPPPMDPALQEIVSALSQQPRLIPAVQRFTARLVKHISAAVDKAMGEAESGNIPPDAPV